MACVDYGMHVEFRGLFSGINVYLDHEFQRLNTGH